MIDPDQAPAAFGLAEDWPALATGRHAHRRAQLLYATAGAMRLVTDRVTAVLPPDRAAWIPGGVAHDVTCRRPVALRTVYFDPGDPTEDDGDVASGDRRASEPPGRPGGPRAVRRWARPSPTGRCRRRPPHPSPSPSGAVKKSPVYTPREWGQVARPD